MATVKAIHTIHTKVGGKQVVIEPQSSFEVDGEDLTRFLKLGAVVVISTSASLGASLSCEGSSVSEGMSGPLATERPDDNSVEDRPLGDSAGESSGVASSSFSDEGEIDRDEDDLI